MEQKGSLTGKQQLVFDRVVNDTSFSPFYFTGGTALSVFYLNHRESDDLDFFSENSFDPKLVLSKVNIYSRELDFKFLYRVQENSHVFQIDFNNDQLKVDFTYYPYKRIKMGQLVGGIRVDSFEDIATNKLITINQRSEVKDFVDLFFLLERYTVWDLIAMVESKFGTKTDPFLLASDFMKVEDFEFLPKMIKPLGLKQLKDLFRESARGLSEKVVI